MASSSPEIVPSPYSEARAVDPEEAFVAALSSCHMLWFLSIAAKRNFVVESYDDEPIGTLDKDKEGRISFTRVELNPRVQFSGEKTPLPEDLDLMHAQAHERCFIAHSVKSEIIIHREGPYVGEVSS